MLTNPGPIQGFAVDQDGSDIAAYRRVKLTAGKLALAGATDVEIGTTAVLVKATTGLGRVAMGDVVMRNIGGLRKMIASEAITLTNGFAKVYAAASGKIAGSGSIFLGFIFVAAAADGDEVDVEYFGGEQAVTVYVPAAAQQSLSGPGAVNVTSYYTKVTTTGADALTLADGTYVGQLKKVHMIVDGGDGTLTPANLASGTTITFADAGDFALLQWNGTDWVAIELGNDADGVTAPVLA